jgi:hypothetical protein
VTKYSSLFLCLSVWPIACQTANAKKKRKQKHTKTWPNWGQVPIVTSHCRMPLCVNVCTSLCVSPCHNVQFFSLSHLFDDRDFLKRNQGIFISNSFIGAIECNFLLSWFHTTVSHYLQQVSIRILCAVFKTPFFVCILLWFSSNWITRQNDTKFIIIY